MKQGPNQKRHRGRSNSRRHQHGLSSNYESNGPDVRIKGSASQVQDRYQALARDAVASGDRVAAENYLQHAEHYQRIINAHLASAAAQAGNGQDSNGAQRVNGGREQPDGRQRSEDGRRGRGRGRGPQPSEAAAPDAPQPDIVPLDAEQPAPAEPAVKSAGKSKPKGESDPGESVTA